MSSDKHNYVANIFENIVRKSKTSAMLKEDLIFHIPQESLKTYLSKMKWRVYNNVFQPKGEGIGFSARSSGHKKLINRKLLYVVYSCSFVLPLAEAVRLTVLKRKMCFMLHFLINEYVMFWIAVYMLMKLAGITPPSKKKR